MSSETSASTWIAGLVRALGPLEGFGRGLMVVDLADGRIVAVTEAMTDLLGRPAPAFVGDLVEVGAVARPDLRRLAERYRAWMRLDDVESAGADSTYGWSDSLVINVAGHGSQRVNVEIAIERRPSARAAAALVTCWSDTDAADPIEVDRVEQLPDLWGLYDADLTMIAADPAARVHGIDPAALLGTSVWMYGHPDDLPRAMPRLLDLRDGRVDVVHYSVRVRARHGRWLPIDVEARRLESADGPRLLLRARYVNDRRREIVAGRLTPRQMLLVDGLFDGLRVTQLAERHGLAVKTVRNHLAAAYRTLGVTGQVELLETHHRPDRTS